MSDLWLYSFSESAVRLPETFTSEFLAALDAARLRFRLVGLVCSEAHLLLAKWFLVLYTCGLPFGHVMSVLRLPFFPPQEINHTGLEPILKTQFWSSYLQNQRCWRSKL